MAQLHHLVKQDLTVRSRTAAVDTEETNYTISWANLTGAGFANGDQVGIVVLAKHGASNNAGYSNFQVKKGSTFAGASVLAGSLQSVESPGTTANTGVNYLYPGEMTLATNDNIYFSSFSNSTYTNRVDEFLCFIFKLSDLGTANYKFASTTPSGNAPTTETDGASITLPAGDWLIFAALQALDDSTSANLTARIHVAGSAVNEHSIQGEDTANTMNLGMVQAEAGVAADTVAKIAYLCGTASTHDVVHTAIMGIRLDAFKDHAIGETIADTYQSAVDTYQEVAGLPSYTPTVEAPHLLVATAVIVCPVATQAPYGRIQIGGADWPATGIGRTSAILNGPAGRAQNMMFAGYGTLTTSAKDIDLDYAEDVSIATQPYCAGAAVIALSMELAAAGTPDTGLFDAKLVIRSAAPGLLDGKLAVNSATTAVLDGKATVSSLTPSSGLLDGKLVAMAKDTNLLDGKLTLGSNATTTLDGKVRIMSAAVGLLDGNLAIRNVGVQPFDGKLFIRSAAVTLLDGKIVVRLLTPVTDVLDGKVKIVRYATNLFDGKARIQSAAVNLLDARMGIGSVLTAYFNGEVEVFAPGSGGSVFDGKLVVAGPASAAVPSAMMMKT